jgi:hypothetical protein
MIAVKDDVSQLYCPFKFSPKIINPFCVHDSCIAWTLLNIKNEQKELIGYCGLVGKPPKEDVEINLQS